MNRRRNGVRAQDPLTLFRRALTRLYSAWVTKTFRFASLGTNLSLHYRSELSKSHAHRIKLGDSVVIDKDVVIRVHTPLGEQGESIVTIEDGCVIGPRSFLSAKNYVHIERGVVLGPSVLIQDHSHAYRNVALTIRRQGVTEGGRIRIGQGSLIGQGAVIHCDQGELTLGRGSVVAPNSLVNRSFPAYSLIAGNPAHVVKQFDAVSGTWVLGSARPTEAGEVAGPTPLPLLRSDD
jgi:acetyltransferase-like isoleucine patch superfamily enzyme